MVSVSRGPCGGRVVEFLSIALHSSEKCIPAICPPADTPLIQVQQTDISATGIE